MTQALDLAGCLTSATPEPLLTQLPDVCGHTQITQQSKALRARSWEVKEFQRRIHFQGPYGNSVVCTADALDSSDPNGHVCVC